MIGVSIVSVIILLGVLIFVHELGHFLAAKYSGVGVLKFSLGFGPKIIGRKRGETEYLLSLIPLGGYVKLLGESPDDQLSQEDEKRSFLKQPVGKRILIVAAGPLFNIFFAILVFTLIYMTGVPVLSAKVGGVEKGSVAYQAGILKDDQILAVNGKKISQWDELAEAIGKSRGKPLKLTIERSRTVREVTLVPQMMKAKNIFDENVEKYRIGISASSYILVERKGPLGAFWMSLQQTWTISKLTLVGIVKMIEGVISPKNLGGPILIAQIAGAQVKEGITPFLMFMGLLSINLAILNLLPIPVLDGGHLLFFIVEAIIGREINLRWREIAQQVGLVILILLMAFAFAMDIGRLNIGFINDLLKMIGR
ncbi:MAG: Metalloprotease MmpA [Syntrophus sp. PtaU1.Bin208]|nr:MAG: Metalloprotease MmpA [Syntrophus sp. PtaU1.Bin208]